MEQRAMCAARCLLMVGWLAGSAGASLYIDHMQIGVIPGQWYKGSTQSFRLADMSGTNTNVVVTSGLIKVSGAAGYDYEFNGTISVGPSALVHDTSVGGVASGSFAGGFGLSMTGDLYPKGHPEQLLLDDVLLLQAQMSEAGWTLAEDSPPASNRVRGAAAFHPTGGALGSGVNPPGLLIGDFNAGFDLQNCTPAVTSFGSTSYSTSIGRTIQISAIPEPVSAVLLGIGGILAARKKRK